MDGLTTAEIIKLANEAGNSVLLLLVLWQGLKRFDKLLDLIITLAARANLSAAEVDKIRAQVLGGKNGNGGH